MQIVGLHGLAGAGKDTFADRLVDRHGFVKRGFADPLYEEVAAAYGVEVAWLRERTRKEVPQAELALARCKDENFTEMYFADFDVERSPRWTLERWGTDYRRAQCETYWLDQMADFVNEAAHDGKRGVVIPDVRFANEVHWVYRNLGRVLRILRPGVTNVSGHVSAIPLQPELIELTVHNAGSIAYLHAVADSVISGGLRNSASRR